MMIWNAYWPSLTRSTDILATITCILIFSSTVFAQSASYSFVESSLKPGYLSDFADTTQSEFPEPAYVLRRSLIVPGWGQIINQQWWKVPIIYGLLGGLTFYSIEMTKQYHDYRAAFYNQYSGNNDLRFGPTPAYLVGQSRGNLQSNRNLLHNRRDLSYVIIGLAYLLNVIDAYVYAHLRSFDVSDNLSFKGTLDHSSDLLTPSSSFPSISVRLTF